LFSFVKRHFFVEFTAEVQNKLETEKNIWIASVRTDGRPHLVPVWFIWLEKKIYLSIDPTSIKARNIALNTRVALALEDGSHPVICEGDAYLVSPPFPEEVIQQFFNKYAWEIPSEKQYNQLVEVHPRKWLVW
jgi:F420H(2)-dependent biliverdin reductase